MPQVDSGTFFVQFFFLFGFYSTVGYFILKDIVIPTIVRERVRKEFLAQQILLRAELAELQKKNEELLKAILKASLANSNAKVDANAKVLEQQIKILEKEHSIIIDRGNKFAEYNFDFLIHPDTLETKETSENKETKETSENIVYYSPLEPFRIYFFKELQYRRFTCKLHPAGDFACLNLMRFEDSLFRFDIDITLCFFFTLIAFFFSVISVHFNEISGNFLIKNNIEFFTLKFLIFFWQLFRSNFSNKVLNNLYNIFFIVFFFILLSNILGLIPFSYTITSHLVITFSLSSSLFIGLNINGILKHGLHFFTLFVPKGVSGVLIPFLVVIELISYIARVFSLAIRLFANLMAGHALTTIVNSFIWLLLLYSPLGFLNAFILFIAVYAIGNLEAVIALLQAYVFIMLISLYYQDVLTLH